MIATLIMNAMGHLHVWKGDVHVERSDKYNFHAENKESDLYLQFENDVTSIMNLLAIEDQDSLYKGYIVKTDIPNEYFDMQI